MKKEYSREVAILVCHNEKNSLTKSSKCSIRFSYTRHWSVIIKFMSPIWFEDLKLVLCPWTNKPVPKLLVFLFFL